MLGGVRLSVEVDDLAGAPPTVDCDPLLLGLLVVTSMSLLRRLICSLTLSRSASLRTMIIPNGTAETMRG